MADGWGSAVLVDPLLLPGTTVIGSPTTFIYDDFNRTVGATDGSSNTWGNASSGPAWTLISTSGIEFVDGSRGIIRSQGFSVDGASGASAHGSGGWGPALDNEWEVLIRLKFEAYGALSFTLDQDAANFAFRAESAGVDVEFGFNSLTGNPRLLISTSNGSANIDLATTFWSSLGGHYALLKVGSDFLHSLVHAKVWDETLTEPDWQVVTAVGLLVFGDDSISWLTQDLAQLAIDYIQITTAAVTTTDTPSDEWDLGPIGSGWGR